MAFTSMHMAVGMACSGALGLGACMVLRRGWRWIPLVMTGGALWAITPDLPRIFREDFPSLPFASILGAKGLERWLHAWGDVFFFHHALDAQPKEFALLGVGLMLVLFNIAMIGLMWLERKQSNFIRRSHHWDGRERRGHRSGRSHRLRLSDDGLEAAENLGRMHVRSSHLSRSA